MGATTAFLRPVGAGADVKELEYVATLHQRARQRVTMPVFKVGADFACDRIQNFLLVSSRQLTFDCSTDEDIVYYLKSTHGIAVSKEKVRS
jgi:hypothetical protein